MTVLTDISVGRRVLWHHDSGSHPATIVRNYSGTDDVVCIESDRGFTLQVYVDELTEVES